MFLFNSELFWYKLIFMAELVLAEALFTFRLKTRSGLIWRLPLGLLIDFGSAFLFPILYFNVWWSSFVFLGLFAISIGSLFLIFQEPWMNLLFCAIAAYTTQHVAYDLSSLINVWTGFSDGLSSPYGEELIGKINGFSIIVDVDSIAITYWLMYIFYGSRIQKNEDLQVKRVSILAFSSIIVLIDIVLSFLATYSLNEASKLWIILAYFYNLLSCCLAIFIQFQMATHSKTVKELDIVQNMLIQQQEQYQLQKENIDLINIKCHDLRHQLAALGAKEGTVDKDELKEIENTIKIYDASVKTGNEALDVILTEKSLLCEKNGIRLCCVADGESLSFMKPADIYSLFGNALENSIESTSKLPDMGDRNIDLTVKRIGNLISVHLDNRFWGDLTFENGVPKSSKGDKDYHGFGIRSMKYISKKYNGEFSINVSDHVFNLNVLLPIPPSSPAGCGNENAK
jgi:hypothetical protein